MSRCDRARAGRGFSLVEVIFALLLVGVIYVAAINTLAAARASQLRTQDQTLAYMLAQAQLSELMAQPLAEVESAARREIEGHAGWYCEVDVQHVQPNSPDVAASGTTNARRIRVTIYRGQTRVAELVAARTTAMPAVAVQAEALGP